MNDVPKIIEDAAGISFDDSSHHHFHRKPQWNHSPSRQKQVFRSPRPSSRSRGPSKKGTNKVHLLSKRQTLNNKEVLNSHIWNNNDLVQALALGNGSSSSGWYKKQFQGATLEEVQHALKLSKHFQHNTCCTVLPAEKDAERFEKLHRERQLINIILDIVLDDSVQNKKLHSPNDLVILLVTFLLPINRLKSKLKSKLLLRSNSKRTEQQQHFDRTHVYKLVVAHQFGKEHPNELQKEIQLCQTYEAKFATDVLNLSSSIFYGLKSMNFDSIILINWKSRIFQKFVPELSSALEQIKIASEKETEATEEMGTPRLTDFQQKLEKVKNKHVLRPDTKTQQLQQQKKVGNECKELAHQISKQRVKLEKEHEILRSEIQKEKVEAQTQVQTQVRYATENKPAVETTVATATPPAPPAPSAPPAPPTHVSPLSTTVTQNEPYLLTPQPQQQFSNQQFNNLPLTTLNSPISPPDCIIDTNGIQIQTDGEMESEVVLSSSSEVEIESEVDRKFCASKSQARENSKLIIALAISEEKIQQMLNDHARELSKFNTETKTVLKQKTEARSTRISDFRSESGSENGDQTSSSVASGCLDLVAEQERQALLEAAQVLSQTTTTLEKEREKTFAEIAAQDFEQKNRALLLAAAGERKQNNLLQTQAQEMKINHEKILKQQQIDVLATEEKHQAEMKQIKDIQERLIAEEQKYHTRPVATTGDEQQLQQQHVVDEIKVQKQQMEATMEKERKERKEEKEKLVQEKEKAIKDAAISAIKERSAHEALNNLLKTAEDDRVRLKLQYESALEKQRETANTFVTFCPVKRIIKKQATANADNIAAQKEQILKAAHAAQLIESETEALELLLIEQKHIAKLQASDEEKIRLLSRQTEEEKRNLNLIQKAEKEKIRLQIITEEQKKSESSTIPLSEHKSRVADETAKLKTEQAAQLLSQEKEAAADLAIEKERISKLQTSDEEKRNLLKKAEKEKKQIIRNAEKIKVTFEKDAKEESEKCISNDTNIQIRTPSECQNTSVQDSLFALNRRVGSMEKSMKISPNKKHLRTQSKKVFDVVLSALQINHKSIEGKCDAAINNNSNVLPVKENNTKKVKPNKINEKKKEDNIARRNIGKTISTGEPSFNIMTLTTVAVVSAFCVMVYRK